MCQRMTNPLGEKLTEEFMRYRAKLETLSKEEIINNSYKTAIYEELLMLLSNSAFISSLNEKERANLEKLTDEFSALEAFYIEWMSSGTNSDISECLKTLITEVLK